MCKMPHPQGPRELAALTLTEDRMVWRFNCVNCRQTRGDLMAYAHNADPICVCKMCFLLLECLKMTKSLHSNDPAVLAAETRLSEVHSDLRRAVIRREHEGAAGSD